MHSIDLLWYVFVSNYPSLVPRSVFGIVLDKTCMFTVFSVKDGKPYKHSVKALQIIWNHFPQ